MFVCAFLLHGFIHLNVLCALFSIPYNISICLLTVPFTIHMLPQFLLFLLFVLSDILIDHICCYVKRENAYGTLTCKQNASGYHTLHGGFILYTYFDDKKIVSVDE